MDEYLEILQLRRIIDKRQLRQAYTCSCARYRRLTARGPLRYYRRELLRATEIAYKKLNNPTPALSARPRSLLSRKVAYLREKTTTTARQSMLKSTVASRTGRNSISTGRESQISPNRNTTPYRKNQIEDEYCRKTIYRLEGDLIRYTARQELLQIAYQMGISPFRANLLMAQIVQSVRQYKLYIPSAEERKLQRSIRHNKAAKDQNEKSLLLPILGAVILAVITDILIVRHLAGA